eukprot:scaffold954_cov173-Ochromonas_danica.AAC.24
MMLTPCFRLIPSIKKTSLGFQTLSTRLHASLVDLNRPPSSRTSTSAYSWSSIVKGQPTPQFVFVGGKGGVGKTTTSSAIALSFADSGYRTLVVSTDPAHSLGDALDVNLKSGRIVPIPTETNLWALEIDTEEALGDFRQTVQGLTAERLSQSLGIPKDLLDSLGLEDLASLFTSPPPGIDEIVGLTRIFAYADPKLLEQAGITQRFDRIVVDTAPTGHTLRLLQLPTFLSNLTTKLIRFRSKIMGAMESFQNLLGGGNSGASSRANELLTALNKLEGLQENVARVRDILKSKDQTQFVVVTIPTQLAVLESRRLVTSLQKEKIEVSTILCNQVVRSDADRNFLDMRVKGQRRSLADLKSFLARREGAGRGIRSLEVTEVPYVDTEVTGLYGLRFFHALAHKPVARTATNPLDSRKLTIFGGKGGVGKTTSAASWAVRLSDSGFKTLVVSSDPAHSLGDALQTPLTGSPQLLDSTPEGGQLWAMEIDPARALDELRDVLGGGGAKTTANANDGLLSALGGLPDLKGELTNLLIDVNDPPPGTDEIVAMAKVISFLDRGFVTPSGKVVQFDRIVLDTAPTGHTLRMLELPAFLQKLLQRFRRIRDKADSLAGMFGKMEENNGNEAKKEDKLQSFEDRMARLESVLHNAKETEFAVVTIPTDLAVAETQRLVSALDKDNVLIRRIIVNQVVAANLGEEGSETATHYLDRIRQGQAISIRDLQQLANQGSEPIPLIQVPYFDMEVRTVYGLRAVSQAIFRPKSEGTLQN